MTHYLQGTTAHFSSETVEDRDGGITYLKYSKEKTTYKARTLYLENPCFKSEDKIKIFQDKRKLREFAASRTVLQEIP